MVVPPVNQRLRALIDECGYTQDGLARAVNRAAAEAGETLRTNKSTVSHWLTGANDPAPRTVVYLCEALSRRLHRPVSPCEIGYGSPNHAGAPPGATLAKDPLMELSSLGQADLGRAELGRRSLLTSAVYTLGALLLPIGYTGDAITEAAGRAHSAAAGGRVGAAEIDTVRDITAAFNRADERLGGGFGRTAVIEYLTTDVTAYCAAAGGSVRPRMLAEAAQLAYLAGWKAHDIGDEGLAQRYYLYSYQLAMQAGDPGQAAYAMRILAHQAFDLGHATHCIDLAAAALDLTRGRVDKHSEALFTLTLAKAHAMSGDRQATMATVRAAEKVMARAQPGDTRPDWALMHGGNATQFHNHTAKTLADVGDYSGAEEHFQAGLRLIDTASMPRLHALTMCWMAEVVARRGHAERACMLWTGALGRMGGIQSSRTTAARAAMRSLLSRYRRRGSSEVKALLAYDRSI